MTSRENHDRGVGVPMNVKPASRRRLAAVVALVAMVAALGFFVSFLIFDFPVALIALGLFCVGLVGIWFMLTRRGLLRTLGAVIAVGSFAGIIAVCVWQGSVLEVVGFTVSLVVAGAAIRVAQGPTRRRCSTFGSLASRRRYLATRF